MMLLAPARAKQIGAAAVALGACRDCGGTWVGVDADEGGTPYAKSGAGCGATTTAAKPAPTSITADRPTTTAASGQGAHSGSSAGRRPDPPEQRTAEQGQHQDEAEPPRSNHRSNSTSRSPPAEQRETQPHSKKCK